MKKSLPMIIVFALLLLGLLGFFFMSRNKTMVTQTEDNTSDRNVVQDNNADQQDEQPDQNKKDDMFTGLLKDAVALGVPMKCTYMDKGKEMTGYIKGRKYYGEVVQDNKNAAIVLVDNCLWTWNKGEVQGVKMCFEKKEGDKDIWDMGDENLAENQVKCVPDITVTDAKFVPPSNVTFINPTEQMNLDAIQPPDSTE